MRTINTLLATISTRALATAFEGENTAGWAMDGDHIALEDGNPVYIQSDGTRMRFEASTIGRLNGEARTNRERAEKAERSLKDFEGMDAKAAREALEWRSKVDQKSLVDAGEVDKVRDEISKNYTGQISERDKRIGDLTTELNSLKKANAFNGSDYIDKNVAMPRDMLRKYFDENFRIGEDGKMTAFGADGNKLYSKTRAGEDANFDEAIEQLIERSPYKDHILKAPEQRGTGNHGGGGNRAGGATMSKAAFAALPAMDQAAAGVRVRNGELRITE